MSCTNGGPHRWVTYEVRQPDGTYLKITQCGNCGAGA